MSCLFTYLILMQWLNEHPSFITNQFFLSSDSYAGIYLPLIVQHIIDGTSSHDVLNSQAFDNA